MDFAYGGTVAPVTLLKGIVVSADGRTGFARATMSGPSPDTVYATLFHDLSGDNRDELIIAGRYGGVDEVRVYDGNISFDISAPSIVVSQLDPDGNGVDGDHRRADGTTPWDLGPSPRFGHSLAAASYNDGTGEQSVLVVGAPDANAFDYYDPAVTGACADLGGAAGIPDCEEDTGAVFVYDAALQLVDVLDPYTQPSTAPGHSPTHGNRAGAGFGTAVSVGDFFAPAGGRCPGIAVGAPFDYRALLDTSSGEFYSANPVPTTGISPPIPQERVGQVYVMDGGALPGMGAPCNSWDDIIRTGTRDALDSEFGFSLAKGQVVGDPSDDLIVGSPNEPAPSSETLRSGAVYAYVGGPEILSGSWALVDGASRRLDVASFSAVTCGPSDGDRFGHSVATGDFTTFEGMVGTSPVNPMDIVVGSPGRAACLSTENGAVYVAPAPPASKSEVRLALTDGCGTRGSTPNTEFGVAISVMPLNDYNTNPSPDLPWPSTVSVFPRGQTDFWIAAPGAQDVAGGSTAGIVQSLRGHTRYLGVAGIATCY